MNFLAVVVIGAVLGALDGVGIFFEPKEPYKWQILFAATLKGRTGCASYRIFLSRNYSMVVRDGHRRALRSSLQSRDLSCQGRSQIWRRPVRDPERNHYRGVDRSLHSHLGGENDLTNRCSQRLYRAMYFMSIFASVPKSVATCASRSRG